jgi:SAM-dependent methyltransferase
MERPNWAPRGVDIEQPSAARMYDYYLGGAHHFASDRKAAEAVLAAGPVVASSARVNRRFMQRVVRKLVDLGVRQFLDIGSGIPTVGNVHEIALKATPDAKVVYVDIDPTAVIHARQLLSGVDQVTVVQEDLLHPERILHHPEVVKLFDFDKPVAVLLMAVLHFVSDEDNPRYVLQVLRESLKPGSFLALSHGAREVRPDVGRVVQGVYQRTANPLTLRSRPEITGFFDGFDLMEPGVTWVTEWHPDPDDEPAEDPESLGMLGGVAKLTRQPVL